MPTPSGYSRLQITLHWLTAIGVLIAWFTHDAMEDIAEATWKANEAPFPTVHTMAGMTVFLLVVIRLVVRHRQGAPEPAGSGAQALAAIWGHRVIYALVLAVPLIGFLTWIIGIRNLSGLHELTAKALMLVALGHAAMALWHQYIKKDGTLARMMRANSD